MFISKLNQNNKVMVLASLTFQNEVFLYIVCQTKIQIALNVL